MRRNDRARGADFSLALIDRCTHGVMSLTTGEDVPYCLPLSFVRVGEDLYFHCAQQGRKVDLLRRFPRVCITFIGQDAPAFELDVYKRQGFFVNIPVFLRHGDLLLFGVNLN